MDEPRLETLGLKPLDAGLCDDRRGQGQVGAAGADREAAADRRHDAVRSRHRPGQAQFDRVRRLPVAVGPGPARPRLLHRQDDDARLVGIRKKYGEHIEKMLAMAGDKTAKQDAADILALETAIARVHWTKVESRDPVKTYDKVATKDLAGDRARLRLARLPRRRTAFGRRSPTSSSTSRATSRTSARCSRRRRCAIWKAYLKWAALRDYSRFLDKKYVDERFAFYGTDPVGHPAEPPALAARRRGRQ